MDHTKLHKMSTYDTYEEQQDILKYTNKSK